MERKALGRGLRSLIPEAPSRLPAASAGAEAPAPGPSLQQIDVDRIRPNPCQPRERFDEEQLEELARSLKAEGVLQPVVLRPAGAGWFEVVAGERRWRAAQRAGLLRIAAVVRDVPDEKLLEFALIENLQREDLNPIEEAQAYRSLLQGSGLTQAQVADRVGKQRATIANALRLLSLAPQVQSLVREGALSAGHARALASLTRPEDQLRLAERAVREGISVRQIERLVESFSREAPARSTRTAPRRDPNVVAAEQALQRALGTRVRIVQGSRGGRLELHYFSEEELQRLYQVVMDAARKQGRKPADIRVGETDLADRKVGARLPADKTVGRRRPADKTVGH